MIVGLVPFRKFSEAFAEGGGWAVAVVFFQSFCVCIGDGDVAGLHGYQFLVGFEVVAFREDTGTEKFLLEDVYETEEVFRPSAADIIYGVGREGKAVFAVFLFRRSLHDTDDAFHNVIDVGEVSFAVSVVEDLDGAAGPQFIGESEVGHVRPSGRAVDGEETEACGGNVVEFGIAVGQEFVRFLGSRIEGDGMVHFVVGAEGDFCISAIHGGGGGIHQVLHAFGAAVIGVAAGFQNVVKTDEIGFDVYVGVGDGVTYTGLGSQVHYDVRMPGAEDVYNAVFVCQIATNEWYSLPSARAAAFSSSCRRYSFRETS